VNTLLKVSKILLILSIIIVGLLILYALLRPLFYRIDAVLWPVRPISLEEARNYYSVLSSFASVVFGFSGLLLGFLYFIRRQKFDLTNRKRDQLRKILDVLIDKLEFIDQACNKILTNCGSCVNDKSSLVADVKSAWNTFTSILENHNKFLEFNDTSIYEIVEVFSTVEKQILLQDTSILSKQKLGELTHNYNYFMRRTRDILYSRFLENLG
jgi:uncharacterized protein YuzB (UPF0349 family)